MDTRRTRQGSNGDSARREAAEALAVEALAFLAGEPERFDRFLAVTGIDPEAIRAAAGQRGFLAGVLDHIAGDERLLLDFAENAQIKPEAVMRAASALGGGAWERDIP